jgi:tetratricopeptide (TPR) repeat protein
MTNTTHYWISGGCRQDREHAAASLDRPGQRLPAVDAHRLLRGPYTAAGTLVRAALPEVLDRDPGLARRYDIEVLTAAPDLAAIMPNSRETLTSTAIPAERTRYYARTRTWRIANGLVEFLLGAYPGGGLTLIVEHVDQADPTDLEFLAVAVRRIDPARVTLVLCSRTRELADDTVLADLREGTEPVLIPGTAVSAVGPAAPAANLAADLAWKYVQADGTSEDAALIEAYQLVAAADRAALHDRRAAELEAMDQPSPRTGSLPYHYEHGTDPAGSGVRSLRAAQDYCIRMGFYPAATEYGERALALTDPDAQPGPWCEIATDLALTLSVLSRTNEAIELYDQARLYSTSPEMHMICAYGTAMLYTRHSDPADRDEIKAKKWLNSAIATASLIPDPGERAFQSAFYRNGLALVESHLRKPAEALRLVNESIDILDGNLATARHQLHRSVLRTNRAKVYSDLGMVAEALADYRAVVEVDPNHPDLYLERGNLLRKAGRYEEAAADYETVIRLSPPFPEVYYNRADLRLTLSDRAGALADFSYALELDPTLVDGYVNRAGMYLADGDMDAAHRDALAGLRYDPGHAYLHTVLGQVYAAAGDIPAALAAYDQALASDPDLLAALAGRAEVRYEAGDCEGAIASLNRALAISEDAAILFNRAVALQAAGRWDLALADLDRARQLDPDDPGLDEQIEHCRRQLAAA